MNKIKTFAFVLVLIVSGAGFAAGAAQKVQPSGPSTTLFEFNR